MVRGGLGEPKELRGVERAVETQTPPPTPAVSISAHECEEGQRQDWSDTQQSLRNAKQPIDSANYNVQAGNEKLKKLTEGGYPVDFTRGLWCWGVWGGDSRGPPSQSTGFGGLMDVTF